MPVTDPILRLPQCKTCTPKGGCTAVASPTTYHIEAARATDTVPFRVGTGGAGHHRANEAAMMAEIVQHGPIACEM
jgi:hypothetical protein